MQRTQGVRKSAGQPTAPACEIGVNVFSFLFLAPENLRIPGPPSLAQSRILPPYSSNTPSDGVLTLAATWAAFIGESVAGGSAALSGSDTCPLGTHMGSPDVTSGTVKCNPGCPAKAGFQLDK